MTFNVTKDSYLGWIREKRVKSYIEKTLKWEIEKANYALDKYHAIDFVCRNKDKELIFVQVKGMSWIKKDFQQSAINISIKHNAQLYYFYVGNQYNCKIYCRRWNGWNKENSQG